MEMTSTKTKAVLVAALLLTGAAAMADELPVQAGRFWAPPGDLIGLQNHWTRSIDVMDAYGYDAKAAEDWRRVDDSRFSGLFSWRKVEDDGRWISLRGAGDNGAEPGGAGSLFIRLGDTGIYSCEVSYRSFHHYYDGTSEMRASGFAAAPAPPALDPAPVFNWNRGEISVRYHVQDGFDLRAGAKRTRRSGDKSSLARGMFVAGDNPPAVRGFETWTSEFWLGGAYAHGGFAGDLRLSHRGSDGTRTLDTRHRYEDKQELWSARLATSLDVNEKLRLTGNAAATRLESTPVETWQATEFAPTSDAATRTGQIGLITRLGNRSTLRLSAGLRNQDLDGQTNLNGTILQAADRERRSQDYRAVLTSSAGRARLRLHYAYKISDLDDIVAMDDQPGGGLAGDYQTTAQERTDQRAGLRGRYRLNRKVSLKARVVWRTSEVTQLDTWDTASGDRWFFWMGDRERRQLRWQVSLQTRPRRDLRVDLGYQAVDQIFTRLDLESAETSWKAQRGYAVANWSLHERFTLLGTASLGHEEFALTDGPDPAAGMTPLLHDGSTLRFAPGAVLKLTDKLTVVGHYEGIRYEDKAGAATDGDDLKSNLDRLMIRASWGFAETLTLTASFLRNEFDENRWDDYILDLYTLSLGGRF